MSERLGLLRSAAGLPRGSTVRLVRSEEGHAGAYVNFPNGHEGYEMFDLGGQSLLGVYCTGPNSRFSRSHKETGNRIARVITYVDTDHHPLTYDEYKLEVQPDGEVTTQHVRECSEGQHRIDIRWGAETMVGSNGIVATSYGLIPVGRLTMPETAEHDRTLELFSRYPEGLKWLGKERFAGKNGLGEQEIDLEGEPRSGYFDCLHRDTKWHWGTTGLRHDIVGDHEGWVLNFLNDQGQVMERSIETYNGLTVLAGIGGSTGNPQLDAAFPEGVKRPEDVTQFGDLSVVKLANTGYHIVNLGEGARYGPYTGADVEDGKLVARTDKYKKRIDVFDEHGKGRRIDKSGD